MGESPATRHSPRSPSPRPGSRSETLLIFTLYLISGAVDCADVIGFTGGSVKITLLINQLRSEDTGMYQCGESGRWSHGVNLTVITDQHPPLKQTNGNIDLITDTTEYQSDRFSISDDTSTKVVSVRISDVREEDEGVYYCGAVGGGGSVSYESLFTEIQLQVTGTSTIIIIISVSVCVILLLIGGLIYKLRHSK
ncbi:polymeric immunoglobulin receptor-like [Hoplias malabaricus]|uniref:polymeric immunoglobulin receptor-like n=1 Tax=Hoplias malabaricus TaxID=27720 RepID=UPI0034619AD9